MRAQCETRSIHLAGLAGTEKKRPSRESPAFTLDLADDKGKAMYRTKPRNTTHATRPAGCRERCRQASLLVCRHWPMLQTWRPAIPESRTQKWSSAWLETDSTRKDS